MPEKKTRFVVSGERAEKPLGNVADPARGMKKKHQRCHRGSTWTNSCVVQTAHKKKAKRQ